jgi:hypothetical protein
VFAPLIDWFVKLAARSSFGVFLTPEAFGFYALLLLIIGSVFGNVALTLLGCGAMYFAFQIRKKDQPN